MLFVHNIKFELKIKSILTWRATFALKTIEDSK
jgi:hypothetical protein